MTALDRLNRIREEAEAYRKESLCATCRDDGAAIMDWAERSAELEPLMVKYVAALDRHPMAREVPDRARQVTETRDEVLRRLGQGPPANVPQVYTSENSRPAPKRDGLFLYRPGDARGVVRTWRDELSGIVPRPFGILPGPKRGR